MTKRAKPKAKRPARKPLPREAYDNIPRVSITLTDEATYLTTYGPGGEPAVAVPVETEDVARAFNVFGADTGLLPENCLFWQSRHGRDRIAIWLPPARRTVRIDTGRQARTFKLRLPGFVFAGEGVEYQIWAVADRPTRADALLYQAPLPNVYQHGAICRGSVPFPACSAATIHAAAQLFFESDFTEHLVNELVHGERNLVAFFERLEGLRAFPLNRLVQRVKMADLLAGTETIESEGDIE